MVRVWFIEVSIVQQKPRVPEQKRVQLTSILYNQVSCTDLLQEVYDVQCILEDCLSTNSAADVAVSNSKDENDRPLQKSITVIIFALLLHTLFCLFACVLFSY